MASEGNTSQAMSTVGPAEVDQLISYLVRVVPTLLEEGDGGAVTLEVKLKGSLGKLKRFIEDSQEHALTVVKTLPPEEEGSGELFQSVYDVQLGVQYQSQRCIGMVFIKRSPLIENDKPVRSQLRLIHISEDSPFEMLHSYVQEAVTPLFNTFVQQSRREERYVALLPCFTDLSIYIYSEGDKLASSVQKSINELAVGLLHLQQNIAIPDINLNFHPVVSQAVEKAAKENRRPVIEDVGDYVTDATFLNTLQKMVATWTREIRKVS